MVRGRGEAQYGQPSRDETHSPEDRDESQRSGVEETQRPRSRSPDFGKRVGAVGGFLTGAIQGLKEGAGPSILPEHSKDPPEVAQEAAEEEKTEEPEAAKDEEVSAKADEAPKAEGDEKEEDKDKEDKQEENDTKDTRRSKSRARRSRSHSRRSRSRRGRSSSSSSSRVRKKEPKSLAAAGAAAAAAIFGPAARFQSGCQVRLIGLIRNASFNGSVGRVLASGEATSPQVPGAVKLRLLETGQEFSVRPVNLEVVKEKEDLPMAQQVPSTTVRSNIQLKLEGGQYMLVRPEGSGFQLPAQTSLLPAPNPPGMLSLPSAPAPAAPQAHASPMLTLGALALPAPPQSSPAPQLGLALPPGPVAKAPAPGAATSPLWSALQTQMDRPAQFWEDMKKELAPSAPMVVPPVMPPSEPEGEMAPSVFAAAAAELLHSRPKAPMQVAPMLAAPIQVAPMQAPAAAPAPAAPVLKAEDVAALRTQVAMEKASASAARAAEAGQFSAEIKKEERVIKGPAPSDMKAILANNPLLQFLSKHKKE